MKNRIAQAFLLPFMIILNIVYNLLLLLFSPIFWIGSIFWKDKKYNEMYDIWFHYIPEMPDKLCDEDNDEDYIM